MTTAWVSIAEEIDRMIEGRSEKNHPELRLRFGEGLGLTRQQIIETELLPETLQLVDTYQEITKHGTFAQTATALYCYESQVPEGAR